MNYKIYAFEWCDCIFESAFGIVSLHTTKRVAFKEMLLEANARWQKARDMQIQYGGIGRERYSPLSYEAWRVKEYEVKK